MRRRRLAFLGGAALVLALWMAFGRPGLNSTATGESAPQSRDPSGALQLTSISAGGAAPAGVMVDDEAVLDVPDRPGTRALADDWSGHVFRMREALAAGRLGAACDALDAIAALSLPAEWSPQRDRVEAWVTAALDEAGQQLREDIRSGRILVARARIVAARSPRHERVEAMLRALAADCDVPAFPDADAGAPLPVPEPAPPLAEGRLVRVHFRDAWHTGRVVGDSRGRFTVKIETAAGVYFPVKSRTELEPVEPSPAEAVQQIAIAAAAGHRATAVLWLCHVLGREDIDRAAPEAWRERLF